MSTLAEERLLLMSAWPAPQRAALMPNDIGMAAKWNLIVAVSIFTSDVVLDARPAAAQSQDAQEETVVEFCALGALVDAFYGDKKRELSGMERLQVAHGLASVDSGVGGVAGAEQLTWLAFSYPTCFLSCGLRVGASSRSMMDVA